MRTRTLVVCTFAVGLCGVAAPALAQRASGPYAGALGAPAPENRVQGLDLGASIFGAWDKSILPDSADVEGLDSRLFESGTSAGVAGTLAYDRRGDRARFNLTGGAAAQQYASDPTIVTAYNVGTSVSSNFTSRVAFTASAGVGYSPFYQFAPFGAEAFVSSGGPAVGNAGGLAGTFNYAAVAERNVAVDGSLGLTANFTDRTSAYLSASGRDWRTLDHTENSLRGYGANGGVRHQVTRALAVHVGYGRFENKYAFSGVDPYSTDMLDAGVDYGDSLKFTRRTALVFSTSTQAIRYTGETHYRLNGSAALTRGFNRTWSSYLAYYRTSDFRVGFRAPLLSDSVSAGVSGQMSTRLQLSAGSAYSYGAIGFSDDKFTTASVFTRADFALTRKFAVYGQYGLYHYEVPQGSSVFDMIPRFSREIVMVGLTLRMPLVNSVRPPNEPRQP